MRKIIFIILSFVSFTFVAAQWPDEKNFTLYTTKDGLSSNDIWSVVQDAYGYIWIATKKGLNRFDGNSFQQFYADSSRNSLPQDWVNKLKFLNDEELAAITLNGLHIINTRTLEGHNLIIPADSLQSVQKVNKVSDVLKDKIGNIFIITATGFYHFNNKEQLVFRYDHYSRAHIEKNTFAFGFNIIRIDDNTLLLSATNGLNIYHIAQKKLELAGKNNEVSLSQITSAKKIQFTGSDETSFGELLPDKSGFLWFDLPRKTKQIIHSPFKTIPRFDYVCKLLHINDTLSVIPGVDKGFYLIKFDRSSGSYTFLPKLYFENYNCSSLLIDKNGYLWIPTERGLFKEKRPNGTVEKKVITPDENSLNKNTSIYTMAIANNKVFAGTYDDGVYVLDIDSLKVLKKIDFTKNGSRVNLVTNIVAINNDTLFTGPAGHWINSGNLTSGNITLPDSDFSPITCLYKDRHNNLYVSTRQKLYYRGNGDKQFIIPGYSNNFTEVGFPVHIAEDPEGNMWFAGYGLTRFNPHSQNFDLKLDSFPFIKIPRNEVSTNLTFDNKGNIYFGLLENGLIAYDIAGKKFHQFTRSDGLPDNNILALCFHHNKVWIGTENGLAAYELSAGKISSFGTADGMPADPFTGEALVYDSAHRRLYASFGNSIVRFDPDVLTKNNVPPYFFIENIAVSQKRVIYHPSDKIELSYQHNNLVINLAAVNFEDAYQQQFAYRFVKDGNEPWQQTGSQRSIIFSNLSPGNHRLQMKVFIKNNSWPEQIKEITILVLPPFWQTTWFILITVLLAVALLFLIYRYRIRAIKQRANIDKQLAELEIKGLHAQMNPHFIFNSLNSIKEMILEDEKQNASRYLSKFAQLIRTNLDQSRQTFITVKQCIDHLQQYLEMEKIRFEQFNYTIEMDEDLPDNIRMAPMLIQPLVENAIWHGLRNQSGEKNLNIRFYSSKKQLVCDIEDNGVGINQSIKEKTGRQATHRSLGITSVYERLKVLNEKYNMNSSMEIIDKSELPGQNNNGTLVTLRFNF